MYVFRVENSDFEGPYEDSFLKHDDIIRWPTAYYDADPEPLKLFHAMFQNTRYGFRTLESLTRWFRDDLNELFARGYGGSVYEVDEHYVLHCYKQLLFVADHSIKIAEFPL